MSFCWDYSKGLGGGLRGKLRLTGCRERKQDIEDVLMANYCRCVARCAFLFLSGVIPRMSAFEM